MLVARYSIRTEDINQLYRTAVGGKVPLTLLADTLRSFKQAAGFACTGSKAMARSGLMAILKHW